MVTNSQWPIPKSTRNQLQTPNAGSHSSHYCMHIKLLNYLNVHIANYINYGHHLSSLANVFAALVFMLMLLCIWELFRREKCQQHGITFLFRPPRLGKISNSSSMTSSSPFSGTGKVTWCGVVFEYNAMIGHPSLSPSSHGKTNESSKQYHWRELT